jgi:8-oxo-dGTP diphosphatase
MIDVVCGVIEDNKGQFLACLRPAGKHLAGLWEFPGGKIELGEFPETALIRELQEELAITVSVGTPLPSIIWSDDEKAIRLLPFYCRIIAGEPTALEHEKLLWCAPENFKEFSWAGADLPILDFILRSREATSVSSPY